MRCIKTITVTIVHEANEGGEKASIDLEDSITDAIDRFRMTTDALRSTKVTLTIALIDA